MKIILVRNAEHIGEEQHFWAEKEIGLSEKGKKQAQLLCQRLEIENPTAIYSSDFIRAIETVNPLAEKLELKIVLDSAFRSFDVGIWFGKTEHATIEALGKDTWQEILTNPDPDKRYFEGGETLKQEAERAWSGLETVLKKHSPESTVIISTHLTIISCLLCCMLEVSINKVWFWGGSMAADHPSITIVNHQQNRWYLQHYGCAEHLDK